MAVSAARICNLALGRIGQTQFIASLTENTPAAAVCNEIYEDLRDEVLAAFDWPFATLRALLAVVDSGEDVQDFNGFEYKYALPQNHIRARFIALPGVRIPSPKQRIPYTIEGDATGQKYLYTDQDEARLAYIGRIDNPAVYPPHFVKALACRLAIDLAMALPVLPTLAAGLDDKYKEALNEAVGVALSELQEDLEPDSEFVSGRS